MNKVKYVEFQQRLDSLINKTRLLLNETDNDELEKQMSVEINQTTERNELKLAFVGQYSSGKSTIISALTGDKTIKIDANIATEIVSEYRWNNVILLDTPGILAGKVESHDERTKEALKECDLIFYVLTSQLFDDVLFNNFIDLAYNQHFADKMFIIVNKMGMEDGEYDTLVENYYSSLSTIFKERGYDLATFPIAFIDANDYIDGETENDDEFIQLSHFENFIEKLNSFVHSKGVIKKQFDTPVRILQGYAKDVEVSAVDPTLAELYVQFEKRLNSSQNETKRDVYNELYTFDNNAMSQVINVASYLGDVSEAEWQQKSIALSNDLQKLINTTSEQIGKSIENNYEQLMTEVEDFGNREIINRYYDRINTQLNNPNISIEEKQNLEQQKKAVEWFKKGANSTKAYIGKMAPEVGKLTSGVSSASGSALRDVVYNVGKFFGHKFGPWQATRWATNIAKVAKFGIPVVTTGIDIFMQFREEKKEEERRQQIKICKDRFIAEYQREINNVKHQFEQYLNQVMDNYNNKRKEINDSKQQIIFATEQNKALTKRIHDLEGEYVDFIEIINDEK